MFNIFRYIRIRWNALRTIRARGINRCTYTSQQKLEKQAKDLAWLIVQNKFSDPVLTFKIRGHILRSKKIVRYAEIKGEMMTPDNRKVSFTLSNPYPFPFRMVMHVSKHGKDVARIQGNIHYCFEMLAGR